MNPRSQQVAVEIQRELADLIQNEVRDPRLGYVTITRVELSHDLSFARIFVSEMAEAGKPVGRSMKALEKATGFLRRELGKRLRVHHTPELRFEEDRSIEEGIRMTQLLDDISEDGDGGGDRENEQ